MDPNRDRAVQTAFDGYYVPAHLLATARAEIARLQAKNERLRALLKDCADDLAGEVESRYQGIKDHPAMTPRYERDMEPVIAARAALALE